MTGRIGLGMLLLVPVVLAAVVVPAAPPDAQAATSSRPIVFAASMASEWGPDDIYRVERDGSGLRNLTDDVALDDEPVLSPDGTMIAFVSERGGDGRSIHVMSADGGGIRPLTSGPEDHSPTWHPDGRRVSFVRGYDSAFQDLLVVPADGSGAPEPLGDHSDVVEYGPDWTADGTEIGHMYFPEDGGRESIRIVDPATGAARHVEPELAVEMGVPLDFSPDGKYVLASVVVGCGPGFCVNAPRRIELATGHVHTNPLRSDIAEHDGAYSPDGSEVASFQFVDETGWYVAVAVDSGPKDGAVDAVTDPLFRSTGGIDWGAFGTTTSGGGGGGASATTDRLAGGSRYGTAAAIALHEYPNGAPVVHLARADEVVDAVAGGVLTEGPILLVPSCGPVPTETVDALQRLRPDTVTALGGTSAICDPTLREAAGYAGAGTSDRLAGTTRYGTAVAIATHQFPRGAPVVYVARADLVVDAVAGGVLTDGPILLVPSCGTLPDEVTDGLRRLAPVRVVGLGGTTAVCDQTLTAARDAAGANEEGRLAGGSRYETAVAIATEAFPGTASRVYLARADVSVDAVAGGVLTDGPILLVPPCGTLSSSVAGALARLSPARVTALGGTSAICDEMLAAAGRAAAA